MATVTSVGSGNYNTGGTWDSGSRPGSGDDVIIDNGHTVTLVQPENANSLTVNTGGIYDGDGNILTVSGESSAGWAIRFNNGQISGTDSDFTITTAAATSIDLNCASGNARHLVINDASAAVTMETGAITLLGNLTITAGSLSTGSNLGLTVNGDVIIGESSGSGDNAVLTGNASEIIIHGGMKIDVTGKYDATTHANGTVINKYLAGGGLYALQLIAGGTFIHNDGLVHVTGTGGYSIVIEGLSGSDVSGTDANALHDLKVTLNSISNFVKLDPVPSSNGDTMVITGDLDIVEGKAYGNSTSDNLTVNGNVTIRDGAQLSESTSVSGAMTFGTLTIESGGEYIATSGTTTIKGNASSSTNLAWANSGTFTHNGGTVLFDGTNTFGGSAYGHINPATNTFNNLTIDADSKFIQLRENGTTLTVAGTLTLTDGTLANYGTQTPVLTVTGNATIANGATIGGTDTSSAMNFGSLTIESGGTFIATSGTTTISTGTIDNDGTLTHNKGTIKIDHDTGITLDLTGSDASVIPVYNLIVDTDNTVGYAACTIGNNLTKKGSGRMRPTGDSGRTIEVMGTLLIEAGTFGRGASDTHTNTFGNVVLTGGTIDLTGGGGSGKTIVKGAFRNVGGTVNTP